MLFVSVIFSLLFVSSNGVDWQDTVNRYNDIGLRAESAWALSVTYHSAPEEIRESIIQSIESNTIRNGLRGGASLHESINIINEGLHDEDLLLFLLLTEGDQARRDSLFNKFYEYNDPGDTYLYTYHAAKGRAIDVKDIDITEFKFHHFLISFYLGTNGIADDHFFTSFADYWLDRAIENEFDPLNNDLLKATLIKSAYETDNFRAILTAYNPSLQFFSLPPSNLKRNFFWGIDFVFTSYGLLSESLNIQRNYSIPLSDFIGDRTNYFSININKSANLYELGNYQRAREVALSVMEHVDSFSDRLKAQAYNNLSLIYFVTGEFDTYIQTQQKALEFAREVEDNTYQLQIFRNLHIVYRHIRNFDLSKLYLDQAAELAHDIEDRRNLISIYASYAVFQDTYLGDRSRAYELLDKADSLIDADTEPRLRVRILSIRSSLLNKDGKWNESKALQNQIVGIATEQNDPSIYLEAFIALANIYYQLGDYNEAERLLRDMRAHDTSVLEFPQLVLAQTTHANLLSRKGEFSAALNEYKSVSDLIFERSRSTSQLESGYWYIEPEYLQLFESYADFLISNGEYEEAVAILDRIKTINDAALTDNPLIQASRLSDSDLAQKREIAREMDHLRKKLFSAAGQERMNIQNRLEQLSAQRRSLLRDNTATSTQAAHLNLRNLQRRLNRDQMILHVTDINSNYYFTRITRDDISIQKVPLESDIANLFEEAGSSLVSGRTDLEKLYQIGHFVDISSIPDHIQTIILIPDGYLYQLPLAVIPVQSPDTPFSYGSTRYLIEDIDIYTLNSLHDLFQRPARNNHRYDFTGFGVSDFRNEETSRNLVSLPMAPREVQNISSLLYRFQRVNAFTDGAATSTSFRENAGNSRILHMASHSEVSDSDPLFSRLHFYADASSEGDEMIRGQLFAYELFDLNLNNELVMLNSCESGGDRYLQGTGIMGINRALRYAGVQSLVLNTWSVNDHFAAEFAELFYLNLNRGETKSRALQLAKKEFISGRNANPHYWGPYVLNGNNRPLINNQENRLAAFTFGIIFVLVLAIAFTGRKKGAFY